MTKPLIRIHNVETGEIIDREMTDAEFALFQEEQTTNEQIKAQAEAQAQAQAAAKAALLERLGISEEEAKLLLG